MNASTIDALIARVKSEAARLANDDADSGAAHPADGDYLRLPSVSLRCGAATVADQGNALDRLYGIDNEAFIEAVYRLVMKRDADATALRHYLDALDHGAIRIGIATRLRLSAEGRARGVRVPGMAIAIPLVVAQVVLRRLGLDALPTALLRRYDRRCARRAERSQGLPQTVGTLRQAVHKAFAAWQLPLQSLSSVVMRHDRGLHDLQQRLRAMEKDLAAAREDAQYLRQVAMRAEAGQRVASAPLAPTLVSDDMISAYYVAFENANRGTLDEIRNKLAGYSEWIAEVAAIGASVADIGCGRGEWLQMLGEHGIEARGVDTNPAMVELCRAQGLHAETGDALSWLRTMADGSVGAVTSFHVIEHLPFDYLYAMVVEIRRVLAPGGRLLFETPNPENVLVGSHTFYHDFSHRNPVTPTAIRFLLWYHGFDDIEFVRSSPYPAEARVPGDDPLTERVNGHLCGPQDYAVVARKPLALSVATTVARSEPIAVEGMQP